MRNWLSYPGNKMHHLLLDNVTPANQWRVSLSLAVGVHLLVLLIALLSPYLFHYRRKMPDIYTVNLFTAQDIAAPGPAAPAAPSAPAEVAPREVKKKVETPAPPKVETPPPAPVQPPPLQAISTKPLPAKTKSDLDKLKKIKEALITEQKAKEAEKNAQEKTKEAVEALKQALKAQKVAEKATAAGASAAGTQPNGQTTAAGGPSGSAMVDEITRRYLIAVNSQIQEHWKLPDLQSWKEDLEAVMVIRVRRDGVVVDNFFENRSENLYFNQFVEKAIKDAAPLPAFPVGLDLKEMEIGLRFRPGRVF